MRFWHLNIELLRQRSIKGTLNRHFGSSQFCRLLLRLKVFRIITLKCLHDSNAEYSDTAV